MHIISRKRLKEFIAAHPDAGPPLDDWYRIVKANQYESSHELKADFSSVSFLGNGRTVFNIGGNKYRLVVIVRYRGRGTVYIRHVLTHGRTIAGRRRGYSREFSFMATVLDFTKPHVLRSEAEYDVAVAEIDELLDADPDPGSEGHDRLEFLSVLVEAYEDEHYPMGETGSPQSVVDFMLEQRGMSRSDLAALLGGKSRVSEFFSGKRPLSINQVRAIRESLGIPADLLIEQAPR